MVKPFSTPIDRLSGKRVLITGATGFIGGRLAERLSAEHNVIVRALVHNWHNATWLSRYPVEMVKGDIRDQVALNEAVSGCDIVFHCANGGGSDREYWDINVNGTRNVVDACRSCKVERIIFLSSIAVQGPLPPDGAGPDDEYRSVGNGYADSKIEAEKLLWASSEEGHLKVTVIRPTFVWGPRSRLFTIRPLLEMVHSRFFLVDEGQGDCQAVFIETLIDAIISAGVSDNAIGQTFLVTDGYDLKWKDFYEPLRRLAQVSKLPSLNSKSALTIARCRVYEVLIKLLEQWKGTRVPFWKRVLRRSARMLADTLQKRGVMAERDLRKYARKGSLDTSATINDLHVSPRYRFEEAVAMTEEWVMDQMAYDLGLH
jgi:nucleoside-diphosphate-sugar epimerase